MTPTQSQLDAMHHALLEWQGWADCWDYPPPLTLDWLHEVEEKLMDKWAYSDTLQELIGLPPHPSSDEFHLLHSSKEHRLIAMCLVLNLAKEITDQLKG